MMQHRCCRCVQRRVLVDRFVAGSISFARKVSKTPTCLGRERAFLLSVAWPSLPAGAIFLWQVGESLSWIFLSPAERTSCCWLRGQGRHWKKGQAIGRSIVGK